MAERVPFFTLFESFQAPRQLRLLLHDACIISGALDMAGRTLEVQIESSETLPQAAQDALQQMLAQQYDLRQVLLHFCGTGEQKGDNGVIWGKTITGKLTPIGELNIKQGSAIVEGRVFKAECYETRRKGMWTLNFNITDEHGSVAVRKAMDEKEAKVLGGAINDGMWLRLQGKVELTYDGKDILLRPVNIMKISHTARQDNAPEKRVELHLHTQMSSMDALTDVGKVVKQAAAWGHPAIAITDHGTVQAFPKARDAGKGKIKILYGVEGYYVNNLDDRIAVHGAQDQDFDDEIVCFDIETTGLKVQREAITEIGAVVLKNGKITDTFQTFVNPGRRLTPEIIGLTGITDAMLADAPPPEEALAAFLKFVDGRPLAAHNAEFDIGFIRAGCRRAGLEFDPTYIDSLILAQNLLPELHKHKLDIVAEHLDLPAFNHHRASDDAGMVGYMLIPFFERMRREMGISRLQEINGQMEKLRPRGGGSRHPKHIIILAKNKLGLKHLYQLISASNLKYFKRVPIIPKTELIAHREGLIIGSACEAGELFRAVADRKDWAELKRIASFYDYLEIQPICNNMFMLRNGTVQSEDELREFNRTIVRLGRELGKPVCATGDVHFQEPEDEVYRHILLASKKFADADAPLPIYFKTTEEMLAEFAYLGEEEAHRVVIDDPRGIADRIENIELLPPGRLFPPRLENSEQELHDRVWDKCHELYGDEPPQLIVDRLNVELKSILGKYDVVYMSAQKLVQRSLENGYLVGSRGSVGSSLVAYMSGITEVNSLPPHYRCPKCRHTEFITDGSYGCGADMPDKNCPMCGAKYAKDGFDIPFETFLGYGGGKVPDIDLNFSGDYQSKAHKYTEVIFGAGQTFRAGTIGTLADKTAFGYVKKYYEEREIRKRNCEIDRIVQGCVGVRRTTGQHPGGIIVLPVGEEIYSFTPVQHPANDMTTDTITTHFDYHSIDHNLLKLDILGHDDPTMIRMLEDLTGIDAKKIPLDDPSVMSLFANTDALGITPDDIGGCLLGCLGIPEFGTEFAIQMLLDTKPKYFSDLVRIAGLAHGTDVWLGNAQTLIEEGKATISTAICTRDDIMIYLIGKGLDSEQSFTIMESVRKGKGLKPEWEEEMKAHGVPDWYIWSCKKIKYMFPKAHAAAYVMMAYRIAYCKIFYPQAYYAAFFSIRAPGFDYELMCLGQDKLLYHMKDYEKRMDTLSKKEQDTYRDMKVVREMYARGFEFLPIDIYESGANRFKVKDGKLLPSLSTVSGLGEKAAEAVVDAVKDGPFLSKDDFRNRTKVSKTVVDLLSDLKILDGLPESNQLSLFDFAV